MTGREAFNTVLLIRMQKLQLSFLALTSSVVHAGGACQRSLAIRASGPKPLCSVWHVVPGLEETTSCWPWSVLT